MSFSSERRRKTSLTVTHVSLSAYARQDAVAKTQIHKFKTQKETWKIRLPSSQKTQAPASVFYLIINIIIIKLYWHFRNKHTDKRLPINNKRRQGIKTVPMHKIT
jgi:hypothetical protein